MTAYKIINRISSVALAAASLLLAPALAGCSSEADPVPNPTPEPTPSEMATINLSVAAPFSPSTRAEDGSSIAPTDDERKVNNIWVYFYSVDKDNPTNDGTLWNSYEISSTSVSDAPTLTFPEGGLILNGDESTGSYNEVITNLNIPSGSYRIYAAANLPENEDIKPNGKNGPTETALRNYSVYIINDGKFSYNEGSNLPMFADPKTHTSSHEVVKCYKKGTSTVIGECDSNGIISIGSGETEIKMTMDYQVAKVRLSIVFDSYTKYEDGIVPGKAYPYTSFQISSLKAENLPTATKLGLNTLDKGTAEVLSLQTTMKTRELFTNWDSNNPMGMDKYAKPFENKAYTSKTLFQGIYYLPEARHNATVNSDKTQLELNAIVGSLGNGENQTEDKTYHIYLPTNESPENDSDEVDKYRLTRGCFYDVVAEVLPSGLQMNVRVRKWQNGGRDPFDF